MFYSLLFSLFSVVSSYMISGGIGTAVSLLLARFFTVGKPRLVVVAVQGAPQCKVLIGEVSKDNVNFKKLCCLVVRC